MPMQSLKGHKARNDVSLALFMVVPDVLSLYGCLGTLICITTSELKVSPGDGGIVVRCPKLYTLGLCNKVVLPV